MSGYQNWTDHNCFAQNCSWDNFYEAYRSLDFCNIDLAPSFLFQVSVNGAEVHHENVHYSYHDALD